MNSSFQGQTGERDPFLQVFEAAQLLCPADAHIGIVLTKYVLSRDEL